MSTSEEGRRVLAPGDDLSGAWMTRTDCKRVLAVAPHLQAATRLAFDVLPHLETDLRVQVVWSVPDHPRLWGGVEPFVHGLGGLVLPWHQARDIGFDLVLGGCFWGLDELRGPKVLLPHGIGAVRSRIGPDRGPYQHDLHRGQLMRGNDVLLSALALSHESELGVLERTCPEALPFAVVAGDPCLDRLHASRHLRRHYRHALGVREGQRLVVVTTTWGPHSLFGSTCGTIFRRVVEQLPPDEYKVVAIAHPYVWDGHGRRTLTSWLAEAQAAGLVVLPPEEGWRAALVAADLVIGDHGSVTQYAAAIGVPVLMNVHSRDDVRPGSTAAALMSASPPFDVDAPLVPQVWGALGRPADGFAELVTSRPGESAEILTRTCYRLLRLDPPAGPVTPEVLPAPIPHPGRSAFNLAWTFPAFG